MKRIRLESRYAIDRAVVTVGSFDGTHIGHHAVVEEVRTKALDRDGASVVVTFDPHPRHVISPETAPSLLTSLEEKTTAFERMGLDLLAVVPFTHDLRGLTPEAFVERFLVDYLGVDGIVLGYDHGFGRDRSGDVATMRKLGDRHGFDVISIPPTLLDGEPVSSTRVRECIEAGQIEAAARLLGSGYPVSGLVGTGDGRGRTIGFPTANIAFAEAKLLPPNGVYAGRTRVNGEVYKAVVNLGTRPTFGVRERQFEAHLLDYRGNLYDQFMSVELMTRLRPEQKFDGIESLKEQINLDIEEARCRLDATGIPTDAN